LERPVQWNNIGIKGLSVLLDCVDSLSGGRVTQLSEALLLLEVVDCIKTVINSKLGMDYLVKADNDIKKLVKGLTHMSGSQFSKSGFNKVLLIIFFNLYFFFTLGRVVASSSFSSPSLLVASVSFSLTMISYV
jgi:hypothetical protein